MKTRVCTHCKKPHPEHEFHGLEGREYHKCTDCRKHQQAYRERKQFILRDIYRAGRIIFFRQIA